MAIKVITSESVTEGHPDKLCDQISDAILDAYIEQDPLSRVACECLVSGNLLVIAGEVTSNGKVDIEALARKVAKEIGYAGDETGFDPDNAKIIVDIRPQSADIEAGVNQALEIRGTSSIDDPYEVLGAGDQGMMIGYACNETPELIPLSILLAHKLCQRLAEVRKNGTLPYLLPDGKSQVTVVYEDNKPVLIDSVIVSAQHLPGISTRQIEQDVKENVVYAVVPNELINKQTKIYINPSGRFEKGGPAADTGLTGRKIIVDTYGGVARHGGGCFSGKDPTKVDRSASYAARLVAKNIVAAGLADKVEVQISYAIGKARPTSLYIDCFGTEKISQDRINDLVKEVFDLRPAAIIDKLALRRPIYRAVAAYGHFGRPELNLPWEDTSKAAQLRVR